MKVLIIKLIVKDDSFNIDKFSVIAKLGKEVAIFLGGSEEDNEMVYIKNLFIDFI
jgi:hypothetical protein